MKIAICDDEAAITEWMAEKIKTIYKNAEICCYLSGEELLDSQEKIDILFLDIQMDGKDGMDTARQLRKNGADTMIIFVTAQRKEQKNEKETIIISSNGKHIQMIPEDIVYAEVFNRKVVIHTIHQTVEYYGKLKELEEKLGDDFYRPHRAYLVNFKYVRKYDASNIYLEQGQVLMAKRNYPNFVKQYMQYNQRRI